MRLNDILRICLLSLDSRYPSHTVDFNEAVLRRYDVDRQGWTAREILAWLEKADPDLLWTPAYLLIDASNSAIYLPQYSQQEPAFHIHCRDLIPERRDHTITKQAK